jgi:hypothetical protein
MPTGKQKLNKARKIKTSAAPYHEGLYTILSQSIGANAVFPQIDKRHITYSALYQFFL